MKDIVFLEYAFMFDPAQTWSQMSDFEDQLGRFFRERGMEAMIMKPREGSNRRIIYLRRADRIQELREPAKVGRPQTLKGRMRELSEKKQTARARDFKFGKKIKGFDRVKRKAQ